MVMVIAIAVKVVMAVDFEHSNENELVKISKKVSDINANVVLENVGRNFTEDILGFSDTGTNSIFANSTDQRSKNIAVEKLLKTCKYEEGSGKLATPKGKYNAGWFITPTVNDIIDLVQQLDLKKGNSKVAVIQGIDVGKAHVECKNYEIFQGASQLNALEMIEIDTTPYDGIGTYINDNTQGPRMALSCIAGTFVRNYWITKQYGEQFNALHKIGISHTNGYLIWGTNPLEIKSKLLQSINDLIIPAMIYTQVVGVTKTEKGLLKHITNKRVHQIYSSGAPINTYRNGGDYNAQLEIVSQLLYAQYVGTIGLSLILHHFDRLTGRTEMETARINLTLVGGGVFNVPNDIIINIISAAINYYNSYEFDVYIHGYTKDTASMIRDLMSIPIIPYNAEVLNPSDFLIAITTPGKPEIKFFIPRDYQKDMLEELFKSRSLYFNYNKNLNFEDYNKDVTKKEFKYEHPSENVSAQVFVTNSKFGNVYGFINEKGEKSYFIDLSAPYVKRVTQGDYGEYNVYDNDNNIIKMWPIFD